MHKKDALGSGQFLADGFEFNLQLRITDFPLGVLQAFATFAIGHSLVEGGQPVGKGVHPGHDGGDEGNGVLEIRH